MFLNVGEINCLEYPFNQIIIILKIKFNSYKKKQVRVNFFIKNKIISKKAVQCSENQDLEHFAFPANFYYPHFKVNAMSSYFKNKNNTVILKNMYSKV